MDPHGIRAIINRINELTKRGVLVRSSWRQQRHELGELISQLGALPAGTINAQRSEVTQDWVIRAALERHGQR